MQSFLHCAMLAASTASLLWYWREVSPKSPAGRVRRGFDLFHRQRWTEAEHLLQSALADLSESGRHAPLRWKTHSGLGGLRLSQGEYPSAAAHLRQAVQCLETVRRPNDLLRPVLPTYGDWVLAELGCGEDEAARAAFEHVARFTHRVYPNEALAIAGVLRECGSICQQNHQFTGATWFLARVEHVLRQAPGAQSINLAVNAIEWAKSLTADSQAAMAARILLESWRQLDADREPRMASLLEMTLASTYGQLGNGKQERAWLQKALRHDRNRRASVLCDGDQTVLLTACAEAWRAGGFFGQADRFATRAAASVRRVRSERPSLELDLRVTQLRLAMDRGSSREARGHAKAVKLLLEQASAQLSRCDAALGEIALGQWCLAVNQPQEAARRLQQAQCSLVDVYGPQRLQATAATPLLAIALGRGGELVEAWNALRAMDAVIQSHPESALAVRREALRAKVELLSIEGRFADARAAGMRWLSEAESSSRTTPVEKSQVRFLLAQALRRGGLFQLAAHEEAIALEERDMSYEE